MSYDYLMMILLFAIYMLLPNNSKIEKMDTSIHKQYTVILQRYSKYDPYYFPYPVDECYLSVRNDGTLVRSRSRENWISAIPYFTMIKIRGNKYYIKFNDFNSYLYVTDKFTPLAGSFVPFDKNNNDKNIKFIWEVRVSPNRLTLLWHPFTGRYLALNSKTDNVYTSIVYNNDCLFRPLIL